MDDVALDGRFMTRDVCRDSLTSTADRARCSRPIETRRRRLGHAPRMDVDRHSPSSSPARRCATDGRTRSVGRSVGRRVSVSSSVVGRHVLARGSRSGGDGNDDDDGTGTRRTIG